MMCSRVSRNQAVTQGDDRVFGGKFPTKRRYVTLRGKKILRLGTRSLGSLQDPNVKVPQTQKNQRRIDKILYAEGI